MKNAVIVVKLNKNELFGVDTSAIERFSKSGYSFDEVLFLQIDKERLAKSYVELKSRVENLLIVCDRRLLSWVCETLFSSEDGFVRASAEGCGLLTKGDFTAFLVAEDSMESLQFVDSVCIPHLVKKYGVRYDKMVIKTVGAPRDKVEKLLDTAKRLSTDRLAYNYKREYESDCIEIFYDSSAPRMLTEDVLRIFADGLEEFIYALEDKSIEEQLVDMLKVRGKKIAVAESFTGGGVAKRIVSVSGASEVYFEGLNTYNELSKIKRLGVREYTLKTFGAVSDETAYQMAAGLIATGDVDVAIATTGIAGPKSDATDFPVGLAYIAIGTRQKVYVYRYKFDGNRKEITEKAINHALFLAYRQLKDV